VSEFSSAEVREAMKVNPHLKDLPPEEQARAVEQARQEQERQLGGQGSDEAAP
jgi:hypothetical protein